MKISKFVILLIVLFLASCTEKDQPPVIFAENLTVKLGETFDPLANVYATDDVDDSVDVFVVDGNIPDTLKDGIFYLTYAATDSNGNTATKTISITIDRTKPLITNSSSLSRTFVLGSDEPNWKEYFAINDNLDGLIIVEDNMIYENVNMFEIGLYKVQLEVSDKAGNISKSEIAINVIDINAPEIYLEVYSVEFDTGTLPLTDEEWREYVFTLDDNTDNLNKEEVTINPNVNYNFPGTYYVDFYVYDSSENLGFNRLYVYIIDKVKPTLIINDVNGNITIERGIYNTENTFRSYISLAFDNVDGDIKDKVQLTYNNINLNINGTYRLTYTLYDSSGNFSEEIINVIVRDTTLPFAISTDLVDENGYYILKTSELINEISFDLGDTWIQLGTGYVESKLIFEELGEYSILFKDMSGNIANSAITYTYADLSGPSFVLPDSIVLEAGQEEPSYISYVTQLDDKFDENPIIEIYENTVDVSKVGTYKIVYRATDKFENIRFEEIQVIVEDTTRPVITLTGDSIISMEAGSNYIELGAVVNDNHDNDDVAVIGGDEVNPERIGIYVVTYNYTDANSNDAIEVTRTVNVIDTTAPIITLVGDESINVEVGTNYIDLGASLTDNFDASTTINAQGNVNTSLVGTYLLTYDANDSEGNAAVQVVRTVNVVDTIAPTADQIDDQIIQAGTDVDWTTYINNASDNYTATRNLVLSEDDEVNYLSLGFYTVTVSILDENQNILEINFNVEVIDTTAPTITLNGNTTTAVEFGTQYIEEGAIFRDNLDFEGNVTISGDTVDVNRLGSYIIRYNAIDSEGNIATEVTRTVNVVDTTSPVITLTGDAEVTLEVGSLYNELGSTFTDNYDANGNAIVGGDNVNVNTVGVYTVTYDVTDTEGNVATQVTRTVNVVDTTAPTADTINDQVTEAGTDIDWTTLISNASDNYSQVSDLVITETDNVDYTTLGTYSVTVTIKDENGNALEITFNVDVQDNTAPEITLVGDATINLSVGDEYSELGAIYTDNLDASGDAITGGDVVDTSTPGTYTITYDFTDSEGNAATQVTRVVIVS